MSLNKLLKLYYITLRCVGPLNLRVALKAGIQAFACLVASQLDHQDASICIVRVRVRVHVRVRVRVRVRTSKADRACALGESLP